MSQCVATLWQDDVFVSQYNNVAIVTTRHSPEVARSAPSDDVGQVTKTSLKINIITLIDAFLKKKTRKNIFTQPS